MAMNVMYAEKRVVHAEKTARSVYENNNHNNHNNEYNNN
jgi:hypothetical protein